MAKYARDLQSIRFLDLEFQHFNVRHQPYMKFLSTSGSQFLDTGSFPKENYLFGLVFQPWYRSSTS